VDTAYPPEKEEVSESWSASQGLRRGGPLRPGTTHVALCAKDRNGHRWDAGHVSDGIDYIGCPANNEPSVKHAPQSARKERTWKGRDSGTWRWNNAREAFDSTTRGRSGDESLAHLWPEVEAKEPLGGRVQPGREVDTKWVFPSSKNHHDGAPTMRPKGTPRKDIPLWDRKFPATCTSRAHLTARGKGSTEVYKDGTLLGERQKSAPEHGPAGWSATPRGISTKIELAGDYRARCVSQTSVIPDSSTEGKFGAWSVEIVKPGVTKKNESRASFTALAYAAPTFSLLDPPPGPARDTRHVKRSKHYREINPNKYKFARAPTGQMSTAAAWRAEASSAGPKRSMHEEAMAMIRSSRQKSIQLT